MGKSEAMTSTDSFAFISTVSWKLRNFTIILISSSLPTSHIQRSPAEFVDRPKVAEFNIRQGVDRIFRLKSTL